MNFDDAMRFIESFTKAGKKVTDLSRIKGLLDRVGNPQNNLSFVHIAGTNGKGSVLEYCSAALIRAGYRTGQFTSPFMEHYCDRIRINGVNIPMQELADVVESFMGYTDPTFSQFEISLTAALIYFKKHNCDIVFLETGVGGRLDATNIIPPPLAAVITSISLDHTAVLGNTVEEIAAQKAGIIKNGSVCILAPFNKPSVEKIIRDTALSENCPLILPDSRLIEVTHESIDGTDFSYKGISYHLKMCGTHQVTNAVTAIETVELLGSKGFTVTMEQLRTALSETSVISRIEVVRKDPYIIIDGGHNRAGIDSLIQALSFLENKLLIGVVGMVKGKDIAYAAEKLSDIFSYVYCVDGFIDSAVPSDELAEIFSCPVELAELSEGIKKAFSQAKERSAALVICGSLYLASAAEKACRELVEST